MKKLSTILKMYKLKELSKLWKCSVSQASYKIRHESISIRDYHSVIQAHPEDAELLLTALK